MRLIIIGTEYAGKKTFFQELKGYRLRSWIDLFHKHSHRIIDVDRYRFKDHIIVSQKDHAQTNSLSQRPYL